MLMLRVGGVLLLGYRRNARSVSGNVSDVDRGVRGAAAGPHHLRHHPLLAVSQGQAPPGSQAQQRRARRGTCRPHAVGGSAQRRPTVHVPRQGSAPFIPRGCQRITRFAQRRARHSSQHVTSDTV